MLLLALVAFAPAGAGADDGAAPAAGPAHIERLDAPASLAGTWRFRTGDDPAWAAPGLDDTQWERIQVPGPWGRQGHRGHTGMAWYRLDLALGPAAAAEARSGALGLRLGDVDSSYELYVGGRRVGGVGALPPHPAAAYDRHAVFGVPASAVGADGHLSIALRVWHGSLTRDFQGGITSGPVEIGRRAALERGLLLGDLPSIALVALFALAGLYHLYLFWQRPSLREYLWYGATALLLSAYTFLGTQVRFAVSDDYRLLKNLEFLALYGVPVASVEFFYGVFHPRVPKPVRAAQLGSGAFALAAIATPTLDANIAVLTVWQYTMLVLTGGTFGLVLHRFRHGHPEARVIVGAFGLLSLAVVNDVLRNQGLVQTPGLMPWAFALFVMSMAGSLANRFARTYAQLEHLNANLEDRVRDQTLALEDRAAELETKNKQLEDAYEQLHESSRTDPLTGLRNRRFYLEHIGLDVARTLREHQTAASRGSPGPLPALVFVLVDVDHFKQVNDRHGHDVGDEVLAQVGRTLRAVCRESDYLVRWGGEEFLVVSHLAERGGAAVLAERIRSAIAGLDLGLDTGSGDGVTASVGFACFPLYEADPGTVPHEDVLALADACLYRVKAGGRDGWLGAVRGRGTPRRGEEAATRAGWEPEGLEIASSRTGTQPE